MRSGVHPFGNVCVRVCAAEWAQMDTQTTQRTGRQERGTARTRGLFFPWVGKKK